jgi:hypothetical protein
MMMKFHSVVAQCPIHQNESNKYELFTMNILSESERKRYPNKFDTVRIRGCDIVHSEQLRRVEGQSSCVCTSDGVSA